MSRVYVCPGDVSMGVCSHIPDPEAHPLNLEADTPHGQTNTCENITLPQTSFAGGNDNLRTTTSMSTYANTVPHNCLIGLHCSINGFAYVIAMASNEI